MVKILAKVIAKTISGDLTFAVYYDLTEL
ncbi:uncharacterized protein METZ01_LOCUS325643 [marine metagenome]|uniref:Uncharacterized protein n=1 Tax=marine metagenome TaxID=408172 RepID=A0A382PHA6_9ZZZZ